MNNENNTNPFEDAISNDNPMGNNESERVEFGNSFPTPKRNNSFFDNSFEQDNSDDYNEDPYEQNSDDNDNDNYTFEQSSNRDDYNDYSYDQNTNSDYNDSSYNQNYNNNDYNDYSYDQNYNNDNYNNYSNNQDYYDNGYSENANDNEVYNRRNESNNSNSLAKKIPILIIIIILLVLLIILLKTLIIGTDSTKTNSNTNTSSDTNNQEEVSEKQMNALIATDSIKLPNGTTLIEINNKNNISVDVDVKLDCLDNDKEVNSQTSSAKNIPPKSLYYIALFVAPEYRNNKQEISTKATKNKYKEYYNDKIEIIEKKEVDEYLEVSVKNDTYSVMDYISVYALYYNADGDIIGFQEEVEKKVAVDAVVTYKIPYPKDDKYGYISFSKYDVGINTAYAYKENK